MRIAVSGTHFSGKSTLIASLLEQFPSYTSVEEVYYLMEEDGYAFPEPPALEDFEQQFMCSIKVIKKSGKNTFLDRCPFDYLAYALAIEENSIEVEDWMQKMEDAVQLLDLIVFVPIESPDRILVPVSQDLKLRKRVDEKLQDMILNDSLGMLENIEVLEVVGSLEKRVSMVKAVLTKNML